jgi:hypothetical protein
MGAAPVSPRSCSSENDAEPAVLTDVDVWTVELFNGAATGATLSIAAGPGGAGFCSAVSTLGISVLGISVFGRGVAIGAATGTGVTRAEMLEALAAGEDTFCAGSGSSD